MGTAGFRGSCFTPLNYWLLWLTTVRSVWMGQVISVQRITLGNVRTINRLDLVLLYVSKLKIYVH